MRTCPTGPAWYPVLSQSRILHSLFIIPKFQYLGFRSLAWLIFLMTWKRSAQMRVTAIAQQESATVTLATRYYETRHKADW